MPYLLRQHISPRATSRARTRAAQTAGFTDLRFPAVRFVAHMRNADLFDNASFAISPAESLWMDGDRSLATALPVPCASECLRV